MKVSLVEAGNIAVTDDLTENQIFKLVNNQPVAIITGFTLRKELARLRRMHRADLSATVSNLTVMEFNGRPCLTIKNIKEAVVVTVSRSGQCILEFRYNNGHTATPDIANALREKLQRVSQLSAA